MKFVRSIGITTLFAFTLLEGLLFTAVVPVASAEDVLDRRLLETHMRAKFAAEAASCTGPNCLASLPVFDPPELIVPCTRRTCTYKLTLCGVFLFLDGPIIEGDGVFFVFRVDGVNPQPGPTGPGGRVFVQSPVPQGASIEARCFSVVSTNLARGDHTIEVEFGALNIVGDETRVWFREAELNIAVYTP